MLPMIKEAYDPKTLGALEIWSLANGLMKKQEEINAYAQRMLELMPLLGESNRKCEEAIASIGHVTEFDIQAARLRGILGRNQQSEKMIEKIQKRNQQNP